MSVALEWLYDVIVYFSRALRRLVSQKILRLPRNTRLAQLTLRFLGSHRGKEVNNRPYNLQQPWDIFSALTYKGYILPLSHPAKSTYLKTATHFIKFFAKWILPDMEPTVLLQTLDSRIKLILNEYDYDYEKWKVEYFSGKSILEWYSDFLQNEGKDLPRTKNSSPAERAEFSCKRLKVPGLFTSAELKAASAIITFFPSASELPERMKVLTIKLAEMMHNKIDPIIIACYAHQEISTFSHFFFNGNGRTARIFMNGILLHYKLPAVQLETDEKTKQEYYETVESSIDDPAIFENFIRKKIQQQEKRNSVIPSPLNLCIAARDGDIILTMMLLKAGVDPNECPPNVKNWTPLHYACSKGNLMVVIYLVTHGGDISAKNEANKTPLELIKDLDLIKQIPFIQEQYKTYQEKNPLIKSKMHEKA